MTTRLATEACVLSSAPPEPGQLVEVRRREWTVSDDDASVVSPELAMHNFVKLASIDEDALGEANAARFRSMILSRRSQEQ